MACREMCYQSEEVSANFAQSAMRYNDQSGWYSNQAMGIFLNLQQNWNASAVNRLDKTTGPAANAPAA